MIENSSVLWLTTFMILIPTIISWQNIIKREGHVEIAEYNVHYEADTSTKPIPFSVTVNKTEFMGNAYNVAYNYIYEGKVSPCSAIYGSEVEYDMAYYKWKDDTTVSIRLYNSETEEYEEFYVFGMPSCKGSGMGGWNDDEDSVKKE